MATDVFPKLGESAARNNSGVLEVFVHKHGRCLSCGYSVIAMLIHKLLFCPRTGVRNQENSQDIGQAWAGYISPLCLKR